MPTDDALRAVADVRAKHRIITADDDPKLAGQGCVACSPWDQEYGRYIEPVPWPCPTIAAFDGLAVVLRPFAALHLNSWDALPDSQPVWGTHDDMLTVGDMRRAKAMLAALEAR